MDNNENINLEAEESIIAGLIIDDSLVAEVRDIVDNTDFTDRRTALAFRGIEWLSSKGMSIDLITLSDALKSNNVLEDVGGSAYLASLTLPISAGKNVIDYAKIVADHSVKRKINKIGETISQAASNGSADVAMELVREEIRKVNNLGGKENKYQVVSMLDYIEDAVERFRLWGQLQGLSTGFPSIDELTLGLMPGELIIIAGQTSRGKTLLSMNISNRIAKMDKKILFITLEMTHAELTSRYMFINGGHNTPDFTMVAANTIFQKNDELNWKDIDGLIENAVKELGVSLVVIDHLHYFTRETTNVAEELGRVTKEFKKNAIRHSLPIILISHVRKMGKDEQLSGESLRGSSLIAQDADIVLLVDRDPETNAMGVMIDKNRNRGKLSDRTRDWNGMDEREVNTIFLEFNNTKLRDPKEIPDGTQKNLIEDVFPGAEVIKISKNSKGAGQDKH